MIALATCNYRLLGVGLQSAMHIVRLSPVHSLVLTPASISTQSRAHSVSQSGSSLCFFWLSNYHAHAPSMDEGDE